MVKKTSSLFQELDQVIPEQNRYRLIESKGDHLIASTVNFLRLIRENFSEADANLLEKRFFSAVRNEDFRRFERGMKRIKESKDET